jgi:hypothetical protein
MHTYDLHSLQKDPSWEAATSREMYCFFTETVALFYFVLAFINFGRLCGLVVRVLGYRSGGPGSIPGTTRKKK